MAAAIAPVTSTVNLDEFVAYRGQMTNIRWDDVPAAGGKRFAALKAAAADGEGAGPSLASSGVADSSRFGWDDVDEGPAADDVSWRAFDTAGDAVEDASSQRLGGGRKLTKAQREKLRDEEQLREARESIRKRGWTENEVKWRSWLARRGHDVMVNDWNLYRHIDGECIPPSRDPFWLNANEKPLPDYEAGNEGLADRAGRLAFGLAQHHGDVAGEVAVGGLLGRVHREHRHAVLQAQRARRLQGGETAAGQQTQQQHQRHRRQGRGERSPAERDILV